MQLASGLEDVDTVTIRPEARAALVRLNDSDAERGGGVYGDVEGDVARVQSVHEVPNLDEASDSFRIELSALYDDDLLVDGSLLGLFHTHGSEPAVPSPVDAAYQRLGPWIWVIVGTGDDGVALRAYRGGVELPLQGA